MSNTFSSVDRESVLPLDVQEVFGDGDAPIQDVLAAAREAFPGRRLIVWQGDPQTFAFDYVGGDAEQLLGHPAALWLDPSFWVDTIVHPEDRRDAVAYCALASGKARDHVFEYRAVHPGGGVVWLVDYVRVIRGARGVPVLRRGIMFDITADKARRGDYAQAPTLRLPSAADLKAIP
jgi:PAS domain-containing protein